MIQYHAWIGLPIATRNKIAGEFGIIRKHPIHVVDNMIKEDGYEIKDIELALSVENIQKYLGNNENDHVLLWNLMLDKIEGREQMIVATPENSPELLTPTVEGEPITVMLDTQLPATTTHIPEEIKEIKRRGRPIKRFN